MVDGETMLSMKQEAGIVQQEQPLYPWKSDSGQLNRRIHKTYRAELDPNDVQETFFRKCAGAARFVYNWALATKKNIMEANKTTGEKTRLPSSMDLSRELTKRKQGEWAWMDEVPRNVITHALRNCDSAFKNFFANCKAKSNGTHKGKLGFPKFKSKKNGVGGFEVQGELIRITATSIRLPTIGEIRLKEASYIPVGVEHRHTAVKYQAGRWFVTVFVEEQIPAVPEKASHDVVGVDLGISTLATVSDGTTVENPKHMKKSLRKLKRFQRALSRKQKGSANREKVKQKVAKLHYRVANLRKDTLHKATTKLAKTKRVVVLEDLSVKNMMKNHCLAQAISDASFGEVRRQMEYKGKWYGCEVVIADRWYPSSKTCSSCGLVKEDLTLSDRKWTCQGCGVTHDRDENAAKNLESLAKRELAVG